MLSDDSDDQHLNVFALGNVNKKVQREMDLRHLNLAEQMLGGKWSADGK